MNYYPINLKIEGKNCIVVGGGKVAERKAKTLLVANAKVTLIAPQVTLGLAKMATENEITIIARPYRQGDLQDCWLVICATNEEQINQLIANHAKQQQILVNVVDDPDVGNFVIPAQIARKDLLLTVSTGGKSPAFAKLMRQDLAQCYGPEYGEYLEFFDKLRQRIQQRVMSVEQRENIWATITTEILQLLREGKYAEAEEKIINAIGCART